MRAAIAVVAAVLASAGCYETPKPLCAFLCGADTACPSGYFCATDGWCKLDGIADGLVCEPTTVDGSVSDGPVIDGTAPDASEPDAAIDADLDAAIDAPIDAPIDAAAAMLVITTASPLMFGTVVQPQTATATVMVRNNGGATTSAIAINLTGSSAFSRVTGASDTCSGATLAPATTCSFDVRYAPTAIGPAAGVAAAVATTGGSVSINLTGDSVAALSAPATLGFGTLATGQMASLTATVTNSGAVTSGTITTTPPTGAFTITADDCAAGTVAANAMCSVTVQFAPTATGAQSSMFTLNASPGGPRTVMLTGTGQ